MKMEAFTYPDIGSLNEIQPAGWPDIVPALQFYIDSPLCRPYKMVEKGVMIGIGATINYGHTAWLAHIIVHPDHRNKGIGSAIAKHLVQSLQDGVCRTVLLIATHLGEPVYRKLGFETDCEYMALKRDEVVPIEIPDNKNIASYKEKYINEILELDRQVSGEQRKALLLPHLQAGMYYVEQEKIFGFYLPSFGEGLLIANTSEAGLALMPLRYTMAEKAIFPVANTVASDYVQAYGFTTRLIVPRMWLGERISWQPEKLYSRIAGNLG